MTRNILQSSYYDEDGNMLWTERMAMSRMDGIGDVLVKDSVEYRVARVAIANCTQIVNLRRVRLPVRGILGASRTGIIWDE
jgi:hypothetical protein